MEMTMSDSIPRRSFVGGLLALATGSAATSSQPPCEDVNKLVHWYGEEAVLRHLQLLLDSGEEVTFPTLKRSLRRERDRENRQAAARKRREEHRDVVLYRGPAYLSSSIRNLIAGLRPVTSGVNRRTLLVGTTPCVTHVKHHAIPVGTRILVDGRRDLAEVVVVEYVQCETDRTPFRLHVYAAGSGSISDFCPDHVTIPTLDIGHPVQREDVDHLYEIQEKLS
jgi:hypothetical protein